MTEQTVQLVPTGAPEIVPAEPPPAAAAVEDKPKKDKDKKKHKKEQSRGIETMFRVTYSNHIALSRLADIKISMLITANSGIISVVIGLVTKTGYRRGHFAPILALLAGCLVSLVSRCRPLGRASIARGSTSTTSVTIPAISVLRAVHEHVSALQFQECVHVLMKEPALLYDHLTRQLYHMGESLNRKYRYLQIAYSAFLTGIGLATVLFAFVYLTGGLNAPRAVGARAKARVRRFGVKIARD